jgi:hypothetical protein
VAQNSWNLAKEEEEDLEEESKTISKEDEADGKQSC